jgi:Zn ribbon nucleic-acid-binding protein
MSTAVNASTLCPACGYRLGFHAWNEGSSSHEICPSCGIQFGYDDGAGGDVNRRKQIHRDWRKRWIAKGMRWYSRGQKEPSNWNPLEQLRAAGLEE